jgi:rubrerythrin
MATYVETHVQAETALAEGARAKGEYCCSDCGYGVTIYRRLPRCPMCGAGSWEQTDWSPFGRAAGPTGLVDDL